DRDRREEQASELTKMASASRVFDLGTGTAADCIGNRTFRLMIGGHHRQIVPQHAERVHRGGCRGSRTLVPEQGHQQRVRHRYSNLSHFMKIATVGAGPAGASAAARLARDGARIWLFDGSHPREKPCGGGVTGRAAAL